MAAFGWRIRTGEYIAYRKIRREKYNLLYSGKNRVFRPLYITTYFSSRIKFIFCPEQGVYEFDAENNRFIPYRPLSDLLGDHVKIRRLFEDAHQNIWFITDDEVGILKVEDIGLERKITKKVFPKLKAKMHTGWEFIYPYDDHNVIITSTDGFIHYDPSFNYQEDSTVHLLMQEVRFTGVRTVFYLMASILMERIFLLISRRVKLYPFPSYTIQFNFGLEPPLSVSRMKYYIVIKWTISTVIGQNGRLNG